MLSKAVVAVAEVAVASAVEDVGAAVASKHRSRFTSSKRGGSPHGDRLCFAAGKTP